MVQDNPTIAAGSWWRVARGAQVQIFISPDKPRVLEESERLEVLGGPRGGFGSLEFFSSPMAWYLVRICQDGRELERGLFHQDDFRLLRADPTTRLLSSAVPEAV